MSGSRSPRWRSARLLWFTVSGHEIERRVRVPVSYSNVPAVLEMTSEQDDVSVHVRGADTEVSELGPGDLRVIVDLADAHPGTNLMLLRPDQVEAPLGIEVLQIEPGTVTVTLERSVQERGCDRPSHRGPAGPGLRRGRRVGERRERCPVIGPESRLARPISIVTDRIRLDGRRSRVEVDANVVSVDSQVRLAEPRRVRVVVQIVPEPGIAVSERLFGTDGVRGVAGMWPLDPPTIARLGAALVRVLSLDRRARILVGRDTRESGEWIERELARGRTAAGADVVSAGVVPTPAVAYLAGLLDVDLGVVLSASHNPHGDNGIKVFSGRGEKFGEAERASVERRVADDGWTVGVASGSVNVNPSLVDAYLEHTHRLMPSAGRLAGARLALDMANGATTTTAPRLFQRLGFDVVALGDRPDGRNINLACGSTHPANVAAAMVAGHCRLGVAFDGDGDRVILVDGRGQVVDGDAVLLILALAYHARRPAQRQHGGRHGDEQHWPRARARRTRDSAHPDTGR